MNRSIMVLALSIVVAGGCRSEVDQKPAAEVTETSAATTATRPPGADASRVIREKSSIDWVGAKVTRDHDGTFHEFDGWIEYAAGRPSRIAFDIDLTSVESDEEKLTAHLKSADFFDVARYPKATFTSTSIAEAPAGAPAGTTHRVTGVLDLHGAKKEVTFPVTAEVTGEGVRTRSEFTINRHDWGISYRGAADDLIRDNVLIRLDLMFPPPPPA
ncbi:MAG TPA: YceI family protein [Thermoanaerobaculia bacterium]|nr:YceI family protein [Thermoanaerobaculia bacterium]